MRSCLSACSVVWFQVYSNSGCCGRRQLVEEALVGDPRRPCRQGVVQGVEREVGDHQDDRTLARGQPVGEQPVVGHRGGDHRDQLLEDRVLVRDGVGAAGGGHQVGQRDEQLGPAIGRRQRQLELGDDTVGAVGVVDLLDVGAAQLEDPRLCLHGHDAGRQDVAAVAQEAPGDRADARAAAGDVAAERAGLVGAGVQPQLLAAVGDGGGIEVGELDPGLGADPAVADRLDRGQLGQVEDDAALERHGLAVIAGAAAAHGHAARDAGGRRRRRARPRPRRAA